MGSGGQEEPQQPRVVPGTISPISYVGPSIISFAVTELFSERLFALSVSFPELPQQHQSFNRAG